MQLPCLSRGYISSKVTIPVLLMKDWPILLQRFWHGDSSLNTEALFVLVFMAGVLVCFVMHAVYVLGFLAWFVYYGWFGLMAWLDN